MWEPLETTKQEMIDTVERISELTAVVEQKVNQQVGKLQSLAANLPKSGGKLYSNKFKYIQVAEILKERFEIGGFDDCYPEEQEIIEEFIYQTLRKENYEKT